MGAVADGSSGWRATQGKILVSVEVSSRWRRGARDPGRRELSLAAGKTSCSQSLPLGRQYGQGTLGPAAGEGHTTPMRTLALIAWGGGPTHCRGARLALEPTVDGRAKKR